MRKLIVVTLAAVATAAAVVAVASATPRPPDAVHVERVPAVTIRGVHSGGGCVAADLWIRGFRMAPYDVGSTHIQRGVGHYHVYVNGKYRAFGTKARQAKICGLQTGRSVRIQVVLAHNNHTELAARSQIVTAIVR